MYIGPWQEYKLSKQHGNGGNPIPRRAPIGAPSPIVNGNTVSPDIMRELEKVLQNALDPTAAQAALKAMDQALKSNPQGNGGFSVNQPLYNAQQYRYDTSEQLPPKHLNSLSSHSQEKSGSHQSYQSNSARRNAPYEHRSNDRDRHMVPMMILSARDNPQQNYYQQPSPLSVRSSKSEPIQSLPSLMRVSPAVAHNQFPTLTSKNLAINHQRMQQHKSYDNDNSDPGHGMISSIPSKVVDNPTTNATKSGYDTSALVNFLRMERNQRSKSEICKLTGWNILHGGGGITADVRSSLASDSSGDNNKPAGPVKDRATIMREKKIAEVQQMKALYLQGSQSPDKTYPSELGNSSFQLHGDMQLRYLSQNNANVQSITVDTRKASASFIMSPIPSPRTENIDQFSDDHMLMVSKYFQDQLATNHGASHAGGIAMLGDDVINSTEQGDYVSLPVDSGLKGLNPSKSMTSIRDQEHNARKSIVFNDEDDAMSRSVSQVPSQLNLIQQQVHNNREEEADEDSNDENNDENSRNIVMQENNGLSSPTRTADATFLFSPPDTAQGKVLATGSFVDDLRSGNLDTLLSWTRQLDNFDIDSY